MTNNMIYTLTVLSGDIWSLTGHLRSEHLNPHNSLSDFNNKNTAILSFSTERLFGLHIWINKKIFTFE